jgi:hypothetical protein
MFVVLTAATYKEKSAHESPDRSGILPFQPDFWPSYVISDMGWWQLCVNKILLRGITK